MGRRYVGFYWTLSARWANFTTISPDPAQAAVDSTTIRYQRELIRQFVTSEKAERVHEIAALDPSPDRATDAIVGDLEKAIRLCRQEHAVLAWVDFATCGWRPHRFLMETIRERKVPEMRLAADPILMDGRWFVPEDHFDEWRTSAMQERDERKRYVPEALRQAFEAVPQGRGQWARMAETLNEQGVPTLGGGSRWEADNVRKAVQKLGLTSPEASII